MKTYPCKGYAVHPFITVSGINISDVSCPLHYSSGCLVWTLRIERRPWEPDEVRRTLPDRPRQALRRPHPWGLLLYVDMWRFHRQVEGQQHRSWRLNKSFNFFGYQYLLELEIYAYAYLDMRLVSRLIDMSNGNNGSWFGVQDKLLFTYTSYSEFVVIITFKQFQKGSQSFQGVS